jgi:hypothetical protein
MHGWESSEGMKRTKEATKKQTKHKVITERSAQASAETPGRPCRSSDSGVSNYPRPKEAVQPMDPLAVVIWN